MSMVSAKARLRPRRSPLRMRQRPHWMTPELETRIRVAMITRGLMANSTPSGRAGQWLPYFARTEKYAAKRPAKNMISLAMNSSMPSSAVLIPPSP